MFIRKKVGESMSHTMNSCVTITISEVVQHVATQGENGKQEKEKPS